jgi:hypothetical protein
MVERPTKRPPIAAATFGPYSDRKLYTYRRDDFLTGMLGLTRVYHAIVGVIPENECEEEFEHWLDHFAELEMTFHYLKDRAGAGLLKRSKTSSTWSA